MNIDNIISQFNLKPHPEGGYYLETYRSKLEVQMDNVDPEFKGKRSCSTAIYFLLGKDDKSALHKIKSDELWHFYSGGPLNIVEITRDDELKITTLGIDFNKGEVPQYKVKAGNWFGAYPCEGTPYSFVGCTVSPGFDFTDFTMAKYDEMIKNHGKHKAIIDKLVLK